MFDKLYEGIGKKIQSLAIGIFIVESIASIITGFVFLFDLGLEYGWWALLIIILGPIVAWISSWLLYTFGKLAEDTYEIKIQNAVISSNIRALAEAKRDIENKKVQTTEGVVHKWRCAACGNLRTQSPCEHCGKE